MKQDKDVRVTQLFGGALVPMTELKSAIPYSRATIYRMINDGTFPRPVRLGARKVAWRALDLETWFSEREKLSAEAA